MYNKTTILQSDLLLSDVAYKPLSLLEPRRPLHMLYIYIATSNCPKSILGLGASADPEGGQGVRTLPLENHKLYGFL